MGRRRSAAVVTDSPTAPAASEPARPDGRRWSVLTLLTALYAAGAFGFLGAPSLAPFLLDAFGLTRFQVGLLLPTLYVGGLAFSLPSGRIADRLGARLCLAAGLGLGAVMLLSAATASSFTIFLGCLLVTGVGWSLVNPAIGIAIVELFPPRERGLAMGIKQTGQTVGGIGAAALLPIVATHWGWRAAIAVGGSVVTVLIALGWRPMAVLRAAPRREGVSRPRSVWWWARQPAIVMVFAMGFGLGMEQSAFLSYLPLFATQALGMGKIEAGTLLAVAQAGGAVARLGLGAASDRWLGGARPPGIMLTSLLTAVTFGTFGRTSTPAAGVGLLVAFVAGAGVLGWVGLYMILSAEVGGREEAGLTTGVGVAFLLAGILAGGPIFGLILEHADSYAAAWSVFASLACVLAIGAGITGWVTRGQGSAPCAVNTRRP